MPAAADDHLRPDAPLRVGVVGTAHWAQEVHAAGAIASTRTELTAVWGRTPAKAARFAARHDVVAAATLDELLERVDVVTFAVPPQAQPPLAVAAALAGKHLLLEKPVATSAREAEAIRSAVHDGGGQAMVFFTRRFVPAFEALVDAARAESWSGARVVWHGNVVADDSPYRDSLWRAEPLAALWDLTPHVLSLLIPVLGEVQEVSAAPEGHGVRVETLHATGARATISVSLNADEARDEFRLLRPDGTGSELVAPRYDPVTAFARALDRLAARVRHGSHDDLVTLDLGVEVTRVLEQAGASMTRPAP